MTLTTEQIQAILDGAPDGATHVDFEGDYIFVNKTTNHLQWVGEPHSSNIINFDIKDLSLLREIISLRKRNAELEHDLKGSQILRSNQSETIRNYHKSKEELSATVERLRDQYERKDLVWFERSEVGGLDAEQAGFIDLNHVKRDCLLILARDLSSTGEIESNVIECIETYTNSKYPTGE